MIAVVVVVSACGGGESGGDSATAGVSDSVAVGVSESAVGSDDGLTTVIIDDVVITLEIPDGAVPAGTEIEIAAADVPAELAGIGNMTVNAFNLEPSGLVFSEPATIRFRFAASGDTGTPLAAALIGGADGTAIFLAVEITRYGDEIEVSALVDHFSPGWLVRDIGDPLRLTPNPLHIDEGETVVVYVEGLLEGAQDRESVQFELDEKSDVLLIGELVGFGLSTSAVGLGDVTCLEETDGVMENAYQATLFKLGVFEGSADEGNVSFSELPGLLLAGEFDWTIYLLGDARCDSVPDITTPVTPGQDPRAHIVSVDPVATVNSIVGIVVHFSQPWDMPPVDLFSFFFSLDVQAGDCSMTAGWETHAGTVTPLGPGPTYLLDDGSIFIDTGCDINPGIPIDITGQSGSWVDESTTQPVFTDFVFKIDPDAVAAALGPFDMSRAVYDLVRQTAMSGSGSP